MADTLSRLEILEIVQQAVQQSAQTVAEQVIQATQQTGGSLSADKKVLGVTSIAHDTHVDEAFSGKTYTDAELWGFDKKQIAVSEQTERVRSIDYNNTLQALSIREQQLNLAEREAKLRKQATLDAIEVSEREQASVLKHAFNTLSLDFRTAAFHPISPNDSDKDAE